MFITKSRRSNWKNRAVQKVYSYRGTGDSHPWFFPAAASNHVQPPPLPVEEDHLPPPRGRLEVREICRSGGDGGGARGQGGGASRWRWKKAAAQEQGRDGDLFCTQMCRCVSVCMNILLQVVSLHSVISLEFVLHDSCWMNFAAKCHSEKLFWCCVTKNKEHKNMKHGWSSEIYMIGVQGDVVWR